MMNKSYIQDQGILERYVLGELNESEQKQLEQSLNAYPELQSELSLIEESLEKLALENAIEPSAHVKNLVFEKISRTNTKIVPLQSSSNFKSLLGIAATITGLLLVGSAYIFSQWNDTQDQLKLVEEQNAVLNNKLDQITEDFNTTNTLYTSINDPNTEKYILNGNSSMPEAKLISYVNHVDKSVIVNTSYLPEIDAEHDYQMWADVEGEMIDMGVIDKDQVMLAMNYIENSESLNITIEPAGGNNHPTVSRLITNVYLK
ncbi:anti-sigma factor domain-containing protein [Psychroserpens sp.]|uniref:anti-sigma factor n=1 Tax=Psychroserpens sp. TaxID=2020870 RepID=UPI003859534A